SSRSRRIGASVAVDHGDGVTVQGAGAEAGGRDIGEINVAGDVHSDRAARLKRAGIGTDVDVVAGNSAVGEGRLRRVARGGDSRRGVAGDGRGAGRVAGGAVDLTAGGRESAEPDDEQQD